MKKEMKILSRAAKAIVDMWEVNNFPPKMPGLHHIAKPPEWQKKLTFKEIQHLKMKGECTTLEDFKIIRGKQVEAEKWNGRDACTDCRIIAYKIGLE